MGMDNKEKPNAVNGSENKRFSVSKFVSSAPGVVVAILAVIGIPNLGTVYERTVATPKLSYEKNQEGECLINQYELNDGVSIWHPQLVVYYSENIVKIIAVNGVYEQHRGDYQKDKKQFSLPCGKWEVVSKLAGQIKEEIVKAVGDEFQNQIFIRKEILVQVTYQNQWTMNNGVTYYNVESGMVYPMTEDEALKRVVEVDVDLDNYESEIDEIISDCVQVIDGLTG